MTRSRFWEIEYRKIIGEESFDFMKQKVPSEGTN
jgi:hypothetical protein